MTQHRRQPKKLESAAGRPRAGSVVGLARRHELLLEAAGCVSWEWDLETGGVSVGGNLPAVLGVPEGSLRTIRNFLDLIHPEDRRMAQASLEQALVKGRGAYTSAFRVVRRDDGRTVFVEDRGFVSWEDDYSTLRVTGFLFELKTRNG